MENLEVVTDVTGTTDYGYQGDRATTLTGALPASISYDHAGRATSRFMGSAEVEGFVHDTLDRLTTIRRNGLVTEILEYAPTGEPAFRKLGTQGTWYVGAVGTVTVAVAAGCAGDTQPRSLFRESRRRNWTLSTPKELPLVFRVVGR
jgi:hypothetical protein